MKKNSIWKAVSFDDKVWMVIAVLTIIFVALMILAANVNAFWECYQKMIITEEVSGNASTNANANASNMYTSDGHLRTGIGVATYQMQSTRDFRKHDIVRYYTICEENGKVVSIIEMSGR